MFQAEGRIFDEDRLASQLELFSFSNLCPFGTACTKCQSSTDHLTHYISSIHIFHWHITKTRFTFTTFALNFQEFYNFLTFQPRCYRSLRHLLKFLRLNFSFVPMFRTTTLPHTTLKTQSITLVNLLVFC